MDRSARWRNCPKRPERQIGQSTQSGEKGRKNQIGQKDQNGQIGQNYQNGQTCQIGRNGLKINRPNWPK